MLYPALSEKMVRAAQVVTDPPVVYLFEQEFKAISVGPDAMVGAEQEAL